MKSLIQTGECFSKADQNMSHKKLIIVINNRELRFFLSKFLLNTQKVDEIRVSRECFCSACNFK